MKTEIKPEDQTSALAEWRGAQAQIWAFHLSRKRIAIILTRKGEHGALHIVGIGSEHLSGPFRWENAEIVVITEPANQWGEVRRRVVDKEAGFELICSDVVLFKGPPTVPADPFDGFIGESN